METVDNFETEEFIIRRKNELESIISSFSDEQSLKIVENLKICVEYLPSFNISEIEKELLQWIMPVITTHVQKLYDDNILLSDTVNDDFGSTMSRDNLQMALEFLQIEKDILEYIVKHQDVELTVIDSIPLSVGQVILSSFKHCKDSDKEYKDAFHNELLELFCVAQELHTLFLRIFETCVTIQEIGEIQIMQEVLDMICNMGEILYDINIKSSANNWKGYATIIQKFSYLQKSINLKLPLRYLTSQISRNLQSISDMDTTDQIMQTVRVTSFLLKVALKLFDLCWEDLENITDLLSEFCCTSYGYPLEFFVTQGCSREVLDVIDATILNPIELFAFRLIEHGLFFKIISTEYFEESQSFGKLNFLNISLQAIVKNSVDLQKPNYILHLIFQCIKTCFTDFFEDYHPGSTFDNLVMNISAAIILNPHFYVTIEVIFLKNILEESTWSALLAMDIWCLLLSNTSSNFVFNTLVKLFKIYNELDFGMNTYRIEDIHLKCLLTRLFAMLSQDDKNEYLQMTKAKINTSTTVKLGNSADKKLVEDVCEITNEKISKITEDDFGLNDLFGIAENFELLSTINFNEKGSNLMNLVDAVCGFWEIAYPDLSNNILQYFLDRLCQVTKGLVLEFSNKQLCLILSQLKILSGHSSFQLSICQILSTLSQKNFNDFGLEGYKISMLISQVFCQTLLATNSNVLKQHLMEVFETTLQNNQQSIVSEILRNSKDSHSELSIYLKKDTEKSRFDKNYYESLGYVKYNHKCMDWRHLTPVPFSKRVKLDEVLIDKPSTDNKLNSCKDKLFPSGQKVFVKASEEYKTDAVNDAIHSLRSEVKCFMNLMKTEKLNRKNVSDLKYLTNQLLSLM